MAWPSWARTRALARASQLQRRGASFPSIFEEDFEGDTFDVNRPRNGDNGTVVGLEMAAQAPLTFLPGVLGGLTCPRITR
jgi:hypothetical protein